MLYIDHVLCPCVQAYLSSLDHTGGQYLKLNIAEVCLQTEWMTSCIWHYINLSSSFFFSFFLKYGVIATDPQTLFPPEPLLNKMCKEVEELWVQGKRSQEDPLTLCTGRKRSPQKARATTESTNLSAFLRLTHPQLNHSFIPYAHSSWHSLFPYFRSYL